MIARPRAYSAAVTTVLLTLGGTGAASAATPAGPVAQEFSFTITRAAQIKAGISPAVAQDFECHGHANPPKPSGGTYPTSLLYYAYVDCTQPEDIGLLVQAQYYTTTWNTIKTGDYQHNVTAHQSASFSRNCRGGKFTHWRTLGTATIDGVQAPYLESDEAKVNCGK